MVKYTEYSLTTDLPEWFIVWLDNILVIIGNLFNYDIFSEIKDAEVDSDKVR